MQLVSDQDGFINRQYRQYNYQNYNFNYGGGQNAGNSNYGSQNRQIGRSQYGGRGGYGQGNNGQGNNGQGNNGQGNYGQNFGNLGGQDFDYYALVVDWPEMICRVLDNSGKTCDMPNDIEDWTIKGLWPQKNNG